MTKWFLLIIICILPVVVLSGNDLTYKPEGGYVPNAETAIKIAVAVWEPIYGKDKIAKEKPYVATLKDGI